MAVGRKKLAIIIGVGIIVLVAIITPIAYFATRDDDDGDSSPSKAEADRTFRVDCYPDSRSAAITLTKDLCEARGCSYDQKAAADTSLGVPCYYNASKGLKYSVKRRENTTKGFKVFLESNGSSPFSLDFKEPVLEVFILSNNLLRFTFDDANANPQRYRVPLNLQLPPGNRAVNNAEYEFNVTDQATFSFVIIRKTTGKVIFDTGPGGLVLSEQFLQLSTKLPSKNVYGLGEHSRKTFRHRFDAPNAWPSFSRDQPPGGDNNLYGVHPFYTCVEDDAGNTHGVLLLNSNAQEYALSPEPMLTYRTIGGVLDFFVFMGPTPENVVQQYTEMIGRPMMPAYWALGFQLCRYGYNSLANLQRAVEETLKYNIPLDVQYADIDHMDERKIFTVDQNNFGGLNEYFKELRSKGMRTIIILDPCIITNETDSYEPYEKMKAEGANIQWPNASNVPENSSDTDGSMLGYVWPKGKVVFPDFFRPSTQKVWQDLIISHHNKTLVFDGLWIDMNEPANFGTNELKPWNWPTDATPYWSLHCGNNRWDEPPYRPLAAYMYDSETDKKPLADKTLCMNAVQGDSAQYRHYDVHSLYGWSQSHPTLQAAQNATGERSVVISRSTFPGSGKYAGHWLGDNTSIWPHLKESIIGLLEFNLFGIPYIGADICGFFQNTTEELCLRWMQLGAFYPFSRNHNSINFREQHPGYFGDPLATASREILETRYWLLPYLYTLFHEAHTEGRTVVRPLHHEFPRDEKTFGIDRQFLWGPALLISPILEEGQTKLDYYLPEGRWYHFYNNEVKEGPTTVSIDVEPTTKPELQLRGGYILALQEPANNTHFSRQNNFHLRAMLDKADTEGGAALGSLFWDDGVSIDTFNTGRYFLANYTVRNRTLEVKVTHSNGVLDVSTLTYEGVIIHGVTNATSVTVSKSDKSSINKTFSFEQSLQMLNVTIVNGIALGDEFTVTWR